MTNKETLYLMEHSRELEQGYSGKYIAVSGEKVVATGRTIHEVYEQTDEQGIEEPLVSYVPREGEEIRLT